MLFLNIVKYILAFHHNMYEETDKCQKNTMVSDRFQGHRLRGAGRNCCLCQVEETLFYNLPSSDRQHVGEHLQLSLLGFVSK